MTILNKFGFRGSRRPILYAQPFALEQLISIQGATTDLRWAMIELALRSFSAMWASAQGRLVLRARRMARGGKPRCARGITTADTMVAAGGR